MGLVANKNDVTKLDYRTAAWIQGVVSDFELERPSREHMGSRFDRGVCADEESLKFQL